MKTLSKQQIAYQALFDEAAVFEDDDVLEILEKKAEALRESQQVSTEFMQYFWGGECLAHDRVWCAECSSYARGECPSAREEGIRGGW